MLLLIVLNTAPPEAPHSAALLRACGERPG
jgi:hypothetical protein